MLHQEHIRLQALASLGILDSAPEEQFEQITRLASLALGASSAAISLIDDRRQWFKSRVGIPFEETPRDQALCGHVVAARDFVEIGDARLDARVAASPLVACEGGIRFYAGAPLIMESGPCIGTLCVFDTAPRAPLTPAQRQSLTDLAQLAVDRIEGRADRIRHEIAAKVVDATSDAVLAVDFGGRINFWNPAAERMFGHDAAQALGRSLDLILPAGAMAMRHRRGFANAVAGDPTTLVGRTVEVCARRRSGEEFPIDLSLARWHGGGHAGDGGFAAIMRDISERKALERDRTDARTFLDTIISNLPAMLFVKDSVTRRYILLNKAGEEIIGRPMAEIIGRTDRELFPAVGDSYHERDTSALGSAGVESYESTFIRDDDRSMTLRTKRIIVDAPEADRKYILGLTEDITDLRRTEARVLHLAHYDSLTGLLNRSSFAERLSALAAEGADFAVLTIDLDRFKAVNDQFGHLTGDRLLIEVGDRLRRIVGLDDIVTRIGGDEFTVIVVGEQPAQRAEQIAGAAVAALAEPYAIDRFVAHSGASIGIVVAPQDGRTIEELRQAADLALYRAKWLGRGTICFFSAEMDDAARDRRMLEADLRRAIACGEIAVAYQPVVAVATGQVSSFEALARWTHPSRGPIGPDVFISIAEECGLIAELGAHVLETACRAAATWRQDLRIAVNLSPMQFENHDLVQTVGGILARSGLSANRLQLEVTEGLVIRDVDHSFRILAELRTLGVQILMDDFGVGYSSLSYFERFKFDKVKIDRSFVAKLQTSAAAGAVIEAVIGLGRSLDMGIVAEGVETDAQMNRLAQMGCTHMQGYLFSEARPAAAFAHVTAPRAAPPGTTAICAA